MMDIVLTNQFFHNLTGSEMSCFELARGLVRRGHHVTIMAEDFGEPMIGKAMSHGIDMCHIDNMIDIHPPDILHLCHKPVSEKALRRFPDVPAVQHVRSEVIPVFEVPVLHHNIHYYISIRPSITKYIHGYGVARNRIVSIDNPFDTERFYEDTEVEYEDAVLFVGTADHLRTPMIDDLIRYTKTTKRELWLAGAHTEHLGKHHDHVKHFGIVDNPEDLIRKAEMCASIFKGRTAIESWLCGVPCWIYNVNNRGQILGKRLEQVPDNLEKYDVDTHVDKVLELYKKIC